MVHTSDRVIRLLPGGSNYMSDKETAGLTPHERKVRSDSSKWVLVTEDMKVLAVWSCKVCMLLIYKCFTYVAIEC